MGDTVNHPKHYNFGKYEAIEVIKDSLTPEQFFGFCMGNSLKYLLRCQHKGNQAEDIRKAMWYLDRILNQSDDSD